MFAIWSWDRFRMDPALSAIALILLIPTSDRTTRMSTIVMTKSNSVSVNPP